MEVVQGTKMAYGHEEKTMFDMTKEQLTKAAENIRRSVCAYAPGMHMCDCKYGAYEKVPVNAMRGERGNGCPELRGIIHFLEGMTEKEFNRIQKRIEKADKRKMAAAVKKLKAEGKWPFGNKGA